MTLEESRLIVLAMTAPQPSLKALAMTFKLVPGGPEPMINGLGSVNPSMVVASVGIIFGIQQVRLPICQRLGNLGEWVALCQSNFWPSARPQSHGSISASCCGRSQNGPGFRWHSHRLRAGVRWQNHRTRP